MLKTPIPLDALKYEEVPKAAKRIHKAKAKVIKAVKTNRKNKDGKSKVLKEAVAIEDLDEDSPITFNLATVKRLVPSGRGRKRKLNSDYEAWKRHAMTIFQNSFVYPFVHASNKYKCFICSQLYLEAFLLKKHTVEEHTLQDMDQELDNKARDMTLKVDVTYLQCAICSDTLNSLQDLKLHLKGHGKAIDPDFQDNLIPFKLGDETFQCQICGETYLKLRLLVVHMNRHFKNYSCEICGSVFVTHHLLKRHLQIHESGSFACEKCDKVFSSTAKRSLHMKGVHLKQLQRRCPMCPERFNSNYQRTKHLRIVHNRSTGLYRCETCGKKYDLKYHLLIHTKMVHLQEKNHECSICNSRFFSKSVLSRHMIIHTGEKNFKCAVCGKAYSRKRNLMEHSRSHEVGCSVCGQNCGGHASVAHL